MEKLNEPSWTREGKMAPREEENCMVGSSSSIALGGIPDPKGTHRLYGGPNHAPLISYWLQYRHAFSACRVYGTVRTKTMGPCARTLELPLLEKSGVFFLFYLSLGTGFCGAFGTFPWEGILGYLAHHSFIRVLRVPVLVFIYNVPRKILAEVLQPQPCCF